MITDRSLKWFPHFAALSEKDIKSIAAVSSDREFEAGERLFTEGHPATHFCLLTSGEVNIVYRLGDDRQVVADTLTKGDAFCWSAILDPHFLTATCVGNKDGSFVQVEAEELRKICEDDAACGYRLVTEVSKTLRDRLSALRVRIAAGL